MRLLRYGPAGRERPAVIQDDQPDPDRWAVDVAALVGDFDSAFFAGDGLRTLRGAGLEGMPGPLVDLTQQRIGPPIRRPGKLVCIGLNYADHAAEVGAEQPDEPVVFLKAPNTVQGPYDDVLIPIGSRRTDWEIELGVVIGSTARYLPDQRAAEDVIFGYCVSNDVSEREWQLARGGQWTKGKSSETFNPLGPWLVTGDSIPDPQRLPMRLLVNDESMQNSDTSKMLLPITALVHYLSQFMVLEPGDLINTGTPAGIGGSRRPRRFLNAGDVLDLEIAGLGRQLTACRDAAA